MTVKTLLLVNEKGGVGKSTAAWHIGYALSAQGKSVLLVDADKQRSLSLYPNDPAGSGYKLGMVAVSTLSDIAGNGEKEISEAVMATEYPNLDIICAAKDIDACTSLQLASTLCDVVAFADGAYDYVIIDFRRDFGDVLKDMFDCGLESAHAIVPVRSEDSFAEGLATVVGDIAGLCDFSVLFSQVYRVNDSRLAILDDAALSILEADFPDVSRFATLISSTPKVGEATFYGQPMNRAFPNHRVSREYEALAREVEGVFEAKEG